MNILKPFAFVKIPIFVFHRVDYLHTYVVKGSSSEVGKFGEVLGVSLISMNYYGNESMGKP